MNHPPKTVQDLAQCSEEPIHIPGSIQPHGVLLAVTGSQMRIVRVSANADELLGVPHRDLLGQSIESIIGELQFRELGAAIVSQNLEHVNPIRMRVLSRHQNAEFDALIHRVDQLLIIELEPAESELAINALEFFRTGYLSISESLKCSSSKELLHTLAVHARLLTGFDRIMVYMFDDEWKGCVMAESKSEEMDSYLGNHFPASDIPFQARSLYAKNRLRLIVNVDAEPSPIVADDTVDASIPLDLSKAILRSMSPVHVEYLKNMGVSASMSISLMDRNSQLRGLIACHHSTPLNVNYQQRIACDFLAQLGSLKLAELEERDENRRRKELRETLNSLLNPPSTSIIEKLSSSGNVLLDLCGASGAIIITDRYIKIGQCPDEQKVSVIIDFLKKTQNVLFVTESLSKELPESADYKEIASGLLAIKLSEENHWLLWFRREYPVELNWAGTPEKTAALDGSIRIHPRRSFAVVKEEVSGKSLPWTVPEIENVRELRTAILDNALTNAERKRSAELQNHVEEMKRYNLELQSQAERLRIAEHKAKEASQRKSEMVSTVSHDLRAPLTSIHGSLALLANGQVEVGARAQAICALAFESSSYLLHLIEDLLDLETLESGTLRMNLSPTSLQALFERAYAVINPTATAAGVKLEIIKTNIELPIDADRMLQVLVNLLSNAVKFSPPNTSIKLSAKQLTNQVCISVKDQGRGIPDGFKKSIFQRFAQVNDTDRTEKGGKGLGLAICRALTEAHGGTIGVESIDGDGSTFWVKLPI